MTTMFVMDPSCSTWAYSSPPASPAGSSSSPYMRHNHGHGQWRTSPMLSSTAPDDDNDDFEQQLTVDCRRSPVSSPTIPPVTPPLVAISFPADKNNTTSSQDVPLVNNSVPFRTPSPAPRFNGFSSVSPIPKSTTPVDNVAINSSNKRLRTNSYRHGLPHTLPPAPTLKPHRPQSTATSPQPDFDSIRNNYLTMLRQKSTTTQATVPTTVAPSALANGDDAQALAFQRIAELTASPEFQSLGDSFPDDFVKPSVYAEEPLFDDEAPLFANEPLFGDESPFLTSPLDSMMDDFGTSPLDTPYSEFMPTPLMRMDDSFDDPVIADRDGTEFSGALFGATDFGFEEPAAPKVPTPPVDLDKLWKMSPGTPALDSMDAPAASAPAAAVSRPVIPPAPRRRTNATGTRKNITPAALIPLDAPTQRRTYLTPSTTSRKAVPAAFRATKRGHSAAFGDDDDDEDLEPLSPTASEKETIEYKRRQNTLAARKSRKRKLEHQQMLENTVEELKSEVTMWRERAMLAQDMLRGAGIKFTFTEQ